MNRCPNCQKEIDIEHYKKRGNCKFCGYKLDLDSSDDSSSKSKLIRTSANKIKNKGNISESSNKSSQKQLLVQKEKYGQAQIKVKRITGVKNSAVSYKSSNTSVAAVSSTGFVTPKKVGTATITVTSKANKKVKAAYKVTVKKNDMVLAVGFDMYDNIKYYVKKHEDGTIENRSMPFATEFFSADKKVAASSDYDYTIAGNNKIIMTSSNENVLRVTEDERLEVIGRGSTVITLKTADGRWSYSWKVTVSDNTTSFSKYVTGCVTGKDMDEDAEKNGFVTKL